MADPDYSLVEDLLYNGFLTIKLMAGDTPMVLKSMNNRELRMVDFREPSMQNWKERASWVLAYSTFIFNGFNVLKNRSKYLPHLYKGYFTLPTYLFMHLLDQVNDINATAANQVEYVEPYSYGEFSRRQWSMIRGTQPCDRRHTGIPGTGDVGMNTHQNLWVYFNRVLDEEDTYEREWNIGRFVASAFNAKGVKKASRKVESKREDLAEERQQLHEHKGEVSFDEDGRIEIVDETPEELLEQIERSIEGEKDYHDRVIEEYEKNIRDQHVEKRKQRRKARQEKKEQIEKGVQAGKTDPYQEYNPQEVEEEVQEIDRQRAERISDAPRREHSRHHQDRTADKFQKWDIIPEEDEDPNEVFQHPMLDDDFYAESSSNDAEEE